MMTDDDKKWAEARFGPLPSDELLEEALAQYEADWAALEGLED